MPLVALNQKSSQKQELKGPLALRYSLFALLLAIVLFVVTITNLGAGLKLFAERFILKPGVVEAMGVNPNFDTFQGSILQQEAVDTPGVIPMYGSSEMSMINNYHPAKVLTPETGVTPFLIGRGGTQTIINVLNLASLEDLRGKKIAIFITPQWFGPGGISQSTFEGNFSALHAYNMFFSSDISPSLKRQIAERILNFPEAYKEYPYLKNMLENEINSSIMAKVNKTLDWLPARMEYSALEVRDFFKVIWQVKDLADKQVARYSAKAANPPEMEWSRLREEAKVDAIKSTDNNPFKMDNKFYQEYLLPKLKESKDSDKHDLNLSSPEYNDLKLLMQVLKEKGAKPLFVIIPMNGRWYDYAGLDRLQREQCYQKLAALVQAEGYPLADFSSHEYEDYYLKDLWHLAWIGWVDVDQKLYEFYRQY
ncbi:D-alanyl-lipoteichoic acid biosynthesis protein DltD [Desulfosporosinus meridiei]|uniref:Protein DltD n=1 Tax=Desulfosporosinus meridiei (strain ATCC BAA-275 / DSM 13257 / KCTC 12902 / NCIMB 13706 / S10) TaxID=768704 RepID=J7IYG7_DESMD|nr:D-alanyl-lipoteichoic acid biosynthesis protein DltD [Desulfosporosinus meridiei]AFQ43751.1 D-alanyl-lipoteichoic acid biosynthesis protein DltD [Desulfosporosinus meridiei DSM 13257]